LLPSTLGALAGHWPLCGLFHPFDHKPFPVQPSSGGYLRWPPRRRRLLSAAISSTEIFTVIASEAKQSTLRFALKVDCFASLAMTVVPGSQIFAGRPTSASSKV
jgi:hypothetical protein